MKVCVIGLGYIGFPTACLVAQAGYEVVGVDNNTDIINKLKQRILHIVNEKDLSNIAFDLLDRNQIKLSIYPEAADIFIIAVPTPLKYQCETANGYNDRDTRKYEADLSYVEQATRDIVPYIKKGNLVIIESTIPPGTTEKTVRGILEKETHLICGSDIFLAHAPERVLPGNILEELVSNDRIVGGIDFESTGRAKTFYETFVKGKVIGTDATTAEFVKLMENTYRDVNVALANEFALIAEKIGINVFEAISLANRHPRVNVLRPGPGVGGHCLAVDPYFIMQVVPEEARLIRLARYINSYMPHHVLEYFEKLYDSCLREGNVIKKIAILGASYKANVGDERESPALKVAALMKERGS
jgi:UDP-N-acetyl-D-mannosaminuronic acid dehydrogenase